MKRAALLLIFLIVTLVAVAIGCSNADPSTNNILPYDTRWVSTDPDMFYVVSPKGELFGSRQSYGQLRLDSEIVEFAVVYDYGVAWINTPRFEYYREQDNEDNIIFFGEGKYVGDTFTVVIGRQKVNLFDESVKELVFVKDETYVLGSYQPPDEPPEIIGR
jgi:hypothetical protein